jgi:D-alanine transaminase
VSEPYQYCHLGGTMLALREARISPLDRGFLFGDGVYEVIPVFGGRPFRFDEHVARLARSLAAIRMQDPHAPGAWHALVRDLLRRNLVDTSDAYVYIQVTRGAENGRNHAPLPQLPPTVFAYCTPLAPPAKLTLQAGIACVTAADTRWARCDIKSTSLLANVLLRQLAVDAGAQETILLRDGWLTDASASTVHIVQDGVLVTPPDTPAILPGTTRKVVEELADDLGLVRETRPVSEAELRRAQEIMLAAATRGVASVTTLDGQAVGSGKPGPAWQRIQGAFDKLRKRLAKEPW